MDTTTSKFTDQTFPELLKIGEEIATALNDLIAAAEDYAMALDEDEVENQEESKANAHSAINELLAEAEKLKEKQAELDIL